MNRLDEKNIETTAAGPTSGFDEGSPNLGSRLREIWNQSGLKQDEFAARIGVTTVTLQNYFKNVRLPNSDFIKQTCIEFGIAADWLLWGTGPMLRDNSQFAASDQEKINPVPEDEPQWMAPEAAPSMGYSLIPKVQARLSAGTGSLETEGKVVGYYAFKSDFLNRKGYAGKMVLMDVAGDSMEPEIRDGDTVLIDESQTSIIAGGLFAVGIEQEVYVKYLHRIPGKLVLRSKNPEYDPIEVEMDGDLVDTVRIVGRVVWSCREYVR